MNQFDYSKIVLTEVQQAIFNKFMYIDKAYLVIEEYNLLSNTGLLKAAIDGKSTWFDTPSGGICELSDKGKTYRTYLKEKQKLQKKQFHQNILINVLCVILGAILGKLPSIINWLNNLLFQK